MNLFEQVKKIDEQMKKKEKKVQDDMLLSSGQGTSEGGMGFAGQNSVPWDSHAPWSVNNDSDMDGISDAFDHQMGPGV